MEMCVSTKHERSSRDTLTIGDVVQMFIDTAKGISHLHTVNIIHRDVAARNLLIEDLVADSLTMDDRDDPDYDEQRSSKRRASKRKKRGSSKRRSILEGSGNGRDRPKWRRKRRVVVCDFGLSRITQNPDQDNHTNSHVGPLKWMAPVCVLSIFCMVY